MRSFAALAALVAASACGSTSSPSHDAGGACNTIANIGTAVPETTNPAALPAMTGGTIADGTYVLTSAVYYAGSTASSVTHKRTLAISGSTVQLVNSDNSGPDVHATIMFAPSGNQLGDQGTCPAGLTVGPSTYTASSTTLEITKVADNQVETYTKQ